MLRTLLLVFALIAAPAFAKATAPEAALEGLLTADRNFSANAAKATTPLAGLSPIFDEAAVMPVPGKGHAIGREAVVATFGASPSYKDGTISWTPIRGGISADGTQGFTEGFLNLTGGDPARRARKYLAYWIKRPEGWRVVTYRQEVREPGEASQDMLAPSLPAKSVKPVEDAAVMARYTQSLAAAEKSFSDRAQIVGTRAAFGEFGRQDAVHMYGGPGFHVGLPAIVETFKEEGPAKIHWGTERSFVASSGDLGVSIGTIFQHDSKDGKGFPFFTIWRRDAPDQPWRYVAE